MKQMIDPVTFMKRRHALQQEPIQVLDGFVQLMDTMGDEASIAEAARVTAQTEAKLPEDDAHLLRYLMRHRHTTPLEMVELKFRVKVAMDTWRQWIRHRTANVNEYSTRYSPAIDECQTTPPDKWRRQSESNRQGSSDQFVTELPTDYEFRSEGPMMVLPTTCHENKLVDGEFAEGRTYVTLFDDEQGQAGRYLSSREAQLQIAAREIYAERLHFGVAKEQARKDLPLSTMTMAVWKIDLHNLLHFLSLRMDGHAQFEIRQYANAIGEIVADLYPVVWEAFKQYRLNAITLTSLDIAIMQKIINSAQGFMSTQAGQPWDYAPPYPKELFLAAQPEEWKALTRCRERDECLAKLQTLGLIKAA